jgi:hypothetical protein
MARIFISYRRRESSGHAERLYDRLSEHFGEDELVIDLALQPGEDLVDRVGESVGSCGALVAIIGPDWARVIDAQGERLLEQPNDFVRLEIEAALARPDVRLVPALVNGASMPIRRDLPHSLEGLLRRDAIELRDGRWAHDVGRLIRRLEEGSGPARPQKD